MVKFGGLLIPRNKKIIKIKYIYMGIYTYIYICFGFYNHTVLLAGVVIAGSYSQKNSDKE